ncbi:MAG: hypothetical protein NC931_02845, partial [Candidatus Omnitrophica bacterium]|nr:hypothetical protein [Candidatus Omnitrophota bacterium]
RQLKDSQQKCAQLTEQKQKLEDELLNVLDTSTNSNEQLTKVSTELRSRDAEIEKLREAAAEQLRSAQHSQQEMEQKLQQQVRATKDLETSLSQLKESAVKTEQQHVEKVEKQ